MNLDAADDDPVKAAPKTSGRLVILHPDGGATYMGAPENPLSYKKSHDGDLIVLDENQEIGRFASGSWTGVYKTFE